MTPVTKTRRLGIEDDHVTLEVRRLIEDAFPGVELVDVSKATMAQRMFKSAEEIEHIKNGARVADIGGAAVVEAIGVGVTEYEVALHGTEAMTREIARSVPACRIARFMDLVPVGH